MRSFGKILDPKKSSYDSGMERRCITINIMLTVSYSLEIPRDEFFQSGNGEVREEMEEQLEKLFPKEIVLAGHAAAKREHLIHYPLLENKNALRCASCGKWLYMPGKEYLPVSLDYCKMAREIPLCPSCAWELEADMENEMFVRKLMEQKKREFVGNGECGIGSKDNNKDSIEE